MPDQAAPADPLAAHIARLVAEAPPPSPAKLSRLAGLLTTPQENNA